MSNPLENWQAVRLSKQMIVNVSVFPEANIIAKEGEKIAVKIPEGSIVYVAITGPKSGQTFVPLVVPAGAPTPTQPPVGHAAAVKGAQQQAKGKKPAATYKPKATQPSNTASAGTNNASAAGGAQANGGEAQQGGQRAGKAARGTGTPIPGRNRNKGKEKVTAADPEPKVLTAEDLKRQREEQAQHEAWLNQRKEFEKKEREEQDRRYRERTERAKKIKEQKEAEEAAKRKKEREIQGLAAEEEQKEGEKESGPKSCWVCNSDKHISRKCPSRCKRSACNVPGAVHSIQNCKEICQLCKGKGHDEWYCEKRCPVCRRGVGDPHLLEDCPIECRLCGAKGHRDRDCEYSYSNRHRN